MSGHVNDLIDPVRLAVNGQQRVGVFELSQMPRINECLFEPSGSVSFDLSFRKEGRFPSISGRVSAVLKLECQCCLQCLNWPVDEAVALSVVASLTEADQLPETYEPLLLDDSCISLKHIIEEELLLALPAIPQHGEGEACRGSQSETIEATDIEETYKPFAALSELIKSGE